MNGIKTIVFDLYNTLVEIKEPKHFFLTLYKNAKDGFGLDAASYVQLVMKNNLDKLKRVLPSEFDQLYKTYYPELEQELNSITVYSEVFEVLDALKKDYQIFLISNLASPYKEPVLNTDLNAYFDKMIFSCDFGYLKPEKEIFLEVENITDNKASQILMVGDSLKSDVLGAQHMGWNALKINRQVKVSAEYEISNLREIVERINS